MAYAPAKPVFGSTFDPATSSYGAGGGWGGGGWGRGSFAPPLPDTSAKSDLPTIGGMTPDAPQASTGDWFGYMPSYLTGEDVTFQKLLSGDWSNLPGMDALTKRYEQDIRGSQAERGTFYSGVGSKEEAMDITGLRTQQANQMMQQILSYLGLAPPRAVAPQGAGSSGAADIGGLMGGFGALLGALP